MYGTEQKQKTGVVWFYLQQGHTTLFCLRVVASPVVSVGLVSKSCKFKQNKTINHMKPNFKTTILTNKSNIQSGCL